MISDKELEIINKSNNTSVFYDGPKTIIEIFNDTVEKYSEYTALVYKNISMNYGEFNCRVNQLADYLITNQLNEKGKIGIYMNRSFELLITMYAIIKAGCAYVPLDPIYPEKRIEMIAEDAEIDLIIINTKALPDSIKEKYKVISFDSELYSVLDLYNKQNPKVRVTSENLLYIMFTSGSTGKPKGVVITHGSVCNGLYWLQEYFNFQPGESELFKTSINFDMSIWELFWPLLVGGILVIAEPEMHKDPEYIVNVVKENNVTTLHFVPSMLKSFLETVHCKECISLKRVICNGEALEQYLVDNFYHVFKESDIYNFYGPTEATVHVSYHKCKSDENCTICPIGKPISNTKLYVLDESLNMLPIGEMGELYIGGECLSLGYYNRSDLTEERFIPNPFSEQPGSKLYKTGDIAAYDENGELNFFGRSDFQIKLHGFRIETEEIEKTIREHPLVKDCAVTLMEDEEHNDKKLVAHIIFEDEYDDTTKIEAWKQIYDETYKNSDDSENVESQNFGDIWRSSYTGKGFSKAEFEELAESTVERIRELKPQKMLEIGCGNGYILHRIAGELKSYIGIDLSDIAIENLKKSIENKKYNADIKLYVSAADELDCFEVEDFDCVIINSVIQYFPSIEYLETVIKKALKLLNKNGFIYIGDIRNYDLQELFASSVQFFKHTDDITKNLREKIILTVSKEKELLVSQNNILYLKEKFKDIIGIEINNRMGTYQNEMTKFRYDAVLFKGESWSNENETINYDCKNTQLTKDSLKAFLKEQYHSIKFTNVINTFLQKDKFVLDKINSNEGIQKVSEIRNLVDSYVDFYDIPIYEMKKIGKIYGYNCFVRTLKNEFSEITFTRGIYYFNASEQVSKDSSEFANIPANMENSYSFFGYIKSYIKQRLPEYMIPSLFVKKDKFEYLPNGKLDRKALAKSVVIERTLSSDIVEAKSEIQRELVEMWKDILKIPEIGIQDSFIELGGHSLLAIRLLANVKAVYGTQVSLVEFFRSPTIENLAILIGKKEEHYTKADNGVPKVDLFMPYPLLSLQQSYYIGRQTDVVLGKMPTHIYCEIVFEDYDHQRFEKAVNRLIEQNGILKSRFASDGTQCVMNNIAYTNIECDDWTKLPKEEQETKIKEKRNQMSYVSIDLEKNMPVLFSVSLIGKKSAIISIYADCICFDGWSFEKLLEKLDLLYSDNNAEEIKGVTYQEYVEYYRQCTDEEAYKKDKEFWLKRIDNFPEIPNIPLLERPENIKDIQYLHKERTIKSDIFEKLVSMASKYEVSPFSILLTIYGKVIASFCRNQRFLVNLPIAKRPFFMENVNMLLGECSDFFLFDFWNKSDESFIEAAKRNQMIIWKMNDHNSFTGTDIVREIYHRTGDRSSLIAPFVFTSLLDIPTEPTINFRKYYYETHTSQVWMDIVVVRCNENIQINFESVKGLIAEDLIDKVADMFERLLVNFAMGKWNDIVDIPLLEQERRVTVPDMIKADISRKSLIELLEYSAEKYKLMPAIREFGGCFTYEDIFSKARKMAVVISSILKETGVPVVTVLSRGYMQYVCSLAILYSGNIYTPLDYDYNASIIKECVDNVCAKLILADKKFADELDELCEAVVINVEKCDLEEEKEKFDIIKTYPEDCVCIIHTSGSTGKPKAIPLCQQGLINCFQRTQEILHITSDDCAFGITNVCHDMSLFDMFGMLLYGGSVAIIGEEWKNTDSWTKILSLYNITVWNSVPSFMEMFLDIEKEKAFDIVKRLRILIHGGDYFRADVAGKILELNPACDIYNVGGPTETTVWSIYHKVSKDDVKEGILPYGKPIGNMVYYILNDNYKPVKPNVIGTMYVKGIGVSKGYINMPKLTKEKFIQLEKDFGKEILYNTGDLGYFREDGTIMFCGRDDNQVKIDGKRIELDGIKMIAENVAGVGRTAVIVKNKNIYLYYESNKDMEETIKEDIANHLPAYMHPHGYMRMDKLPLNSNGKVSVALLPTIQVTSEFHKYKKKNDEIENFLIDACTKALGVNNISIEDNFFALGGNSIRMIKLVSLIRNRYKVSLSINDIFSNPNLCDWHDMIQEKIQEDKVSIQKEDYRNIEQYPLCINQEGLWISEMLNPSSTYTMNVFTNIEGNIDIEKLKKAFKETVHNYKALNVRFDIDDEGIPFQRFYENDSEETLPFYYVELGENEDVKCYMKNFNHEVLDIQTGPLYKATLIKQYLGTYTFVFTCHHIVCDEQSFIIIMNNIFSHYDCLIDEKEIEIDFLGEKECYAKYCINNSNSSLDEVFWRNLLTKEVMQQLPFKAEEEDKLNKISFSLSQEETVQLEQFCRNHNVTEYIVLLTLINMAISKIAKQSQFIVLSPFSDRINMGYEDTVGFFVKNVAIKFDIDFKMDFSSILSRTKDSILSSMKNATVPYENIIRKLQLPKHYTDRKKRIVFNLIDSERKEKAGKEYTASCFEYLKEEFNNPTGLNIFVEKISGCAKVDFMIHESYISYNEAINVKDMFINLFGMYIM